MRKLKTYFFIKKNLKLMFLIHQAEKELLSYDILDSVVELIKKYHINFTYDQNILKYVSKN